MKTTIASLFAIALMTASLPVFAETGNGNTASGTPTTKSATESKQYVLLEPLPCIKTSTNMDCQDGEMIKTVDFENYVQYIFNLVIALSAVAAVFMIVWGGFQYMTSDAWTEKSEGISKLKNAVLGLLLVLCSYLILKTVDPRLVEISSTIVDPLKITTNHETSSFFQNIYDTASKLKAINLDLMQDIKNAQAAVDSLEKQRAEIHDKLYGKDLEKMPDEEAAGLAREYESLGKQITDLKTKIIMETVQGITNAQIQRCLGIETQSSAGWLWFLGTNWSNNLKPEDCIADLQKTEAKYTAQLQEIKKYELVQGLRDLIEEGKTMIKINSAVKKNMDENPTAMAMLKSYESTVTVGATVAGTVYGGVGGGEAGFTVGMMNNTAAEAIKRAGNNAAAKRTITQIQEITIDATDRIKSPNAQKELWKISNDLITALGGQI